MFHFSAGDESIRVFPFFFRTIVAMEIQIGIQNIARELTFEVDQTADEIATAVTEAISSNGVFTVNDTKGRRAIVPVSTLAYVSTGEDEPRRVGFGHQ